MRLVAEAAAFPRAHSTHCGERHKLTPYDCIAEATSTIFGMPAEAGFGSASINSRYLWTISPARCLWRCLATASGLGGDGARRVQARLPKRPKRQAERGGCSLLAFRLSLFAFRSSPSAFRSSLYAFTLRSLRTRGTLIKLAFSKGTAFRDCVATGKEFCSGTNRSKSTKPAAKRRNDVRRGRQPTLEVEQNLSRRAATLGCETVSSARP